MTVLDVAAGSYGPPSPGGETPRGVVVERAATALHLEPNETCGEGSARATPRARARGRGVGRRGVNALTVLDVAAGSCAPRRQDEASEDPVTTPPTNPPAPPRGEDTRGAPTAFSAAPRGAARLAARVATVLDVLVRSDTPRRRGVFVERAATALPLQPNETCGGEPTRATPRASAGGRGVGRRGVGALTVLDVAAGSCASPSPECETPRARTPSRLPRTGE